MGSDALATARYQAPTWADARAYLEARERRLEARAKDPAWMAVIAQARGEAQAAARLLRARPRIRRS